MPDSVESLIARMTGVLKCSRQDAVTAMFAANRDSGIDLILREEMARLNEKKQKTTKECDGK